MTPQVATHVTTLTHPIIPECDDLCTCPFILQLKNTVGIESKAALVEHCGTHRHAQFQK